MKLAARRLVAGATPAAAATIAKCTAASTRVWAAIEGAGTAGTTYYELELSNVGTKTCTLDGWASVWAVGTGGKQIGKPAPHQETPPVASCQILRLGVYVCHTAVVI